MTYLLEDYEKDITGYNVTASVHVEACWPGDPVGETRLGGNDAPQVVDCMMGSGNAKEYDINGFTHAMLRNMI